MPELVLLPLLACACARSTIRNTFGNNFARRCGILSTVQLAAGGAGYGYGCRGWWFQVVAERRAAIAERVV